MTGLLIDHWTQDRKKKQYMSRISTYDLRTKRNGTKWRSAESPCRHLCSHAIQSLCVCHMSCLYRDQSPILVEGMGRLDKGNFNPISSSFVQKYSQKYSLCLLREGIKLRELTKRNFDVRRGILRVKRSLKLS